MIFSASFLITAKNFCKCQSLAVGVVSVGGSIGVLIFGPFLQLLLDVFGWRGTFRITNALLCLACVCGGSFSEPLDEENQKPNQNSVKKSENLKYSSTEDVSARDVESAENTDLNSEELLSSPFMDSDCKELCRVSAKFASKTDMRAALNGDKTLLLISFTKEGGIQDVKVESKKESSKLMDFSVFKVPRFTIVAISLTLMCLGHYTPQLHLVSQFVLVVVCKANHHICSVISCKDKSEVIP